MDSLKTYLLREKFVISDVSSYEGTNTDIIALSNRILLPLETSDIQEKIVIRAQNMHLCIRVASRIFQSFRQSGSLFERKKPFDWKTAWRGALSDFEDTYNDNKWCVVYFEGQRVFHDGDYHPFLDVIEKCAHISGQAYETYAISSAEEAFKKTGKDVHIKYDGNVAFLADLKTEESRCSFIVRGPERTTTFNFKLTGTEEKPINFGQCMMVSASILEGVQLAFQVGFDQERFRLGMIERRSKEEKRLKAARNRVMQLGGEIINLESGYNVRYRPEKPDFERIIIDSEQRAQKIFGSTPKE